MVPSRPAAAIRRSARIGRGSSWCFVQIVRVFRRRTVALGMHREEKGNLFVRTCAGEPRDRRGEGLEVKVAYRRRNSRQRPGDVAVHHGAVFPDCPSDDSLQPRQREIPRDVPNFARHRRLRAGPASTP